MLFKPTLIFYDANEMEFAKIQGNFTAWNFTIKLSDGAQVGEINKKFAGVAKELFTTADHYLVKLTGSVDKDKQHMLLAVACVIDMVYKEYK